MTEVVGIDGFVRLIGALSSNIDEALSDAAERPRVELRFSLGDDLYTVDIPRQSGDWVVESPEPRCTFLASPSGAVATLWLDRFMDRVPFYANGEAKRLTILGAPFLVWHVTELGVSRQAARMCGFVASSKVWRVDITAPDPAAMMLMFQVLRSTRRLG